MSRRRPRALSREERALWESVAKQARPMRGSRLPEVTSETRKTTNEGIVPNKPEPQEPIQPFRIGQGARQAVSPKAEDIRTDTFRVRMDRKGYARLKGGKVEPEARIDLHGMTLAQAHPALTRFILRSQSEGRRLVLVITGKGRGPEGDGPIPERRGVLKRQVPHWLHQMPLSGAILQVAQAHRRHGGDGAFYVYLRRLR